MTDVRGGQHADHAGVEIRTPALGEPATWDCCGVFFRHEMSLHVLVGRSGCEGDSPRRRVAVTRREVARRIPAASPHAKRLGRRWAGTSADALCRPGVHRSGLARGHRPHPPPRSAPRSTRRPPPLPGGTLTSIRDTLATEAAEAEARHDEAPARMHRARSTAGTTSQVYTLRMPRRAAHRTPRSRRTIRGTTLRPHAPLGPGTSRCRARTPARTRRLQRALTDALHTLDHIAHQRSA